MKKIWQSLFSKAFSVALYLALSAAITTAFLFCASSAWAQATTSLRGAVTDPSNAAIPNATVRLTNIDTNLQRTTTTDQQGSYVFAEVVPGHYVLDVSATGFASFEQKGFQLLVNLPATINVHMKVGAATTTVEVTGAAPLLNTTDASQGNVLSGNEISQMPLYGRNVASLLSLQPGVVFTSNRTDLATNDTRGGAVNGARSDQNNVTLDGVDVNDQSGGALTNPSQSAFSTVVPVTVASVQEFRVSTSDYNADEGRSEGAQTTLVTKGGTNSFHGGAYEFNRTQFGEANDFFNKTGEEAAGQPNKPLHLVYNIFGADVGGPVIHNRLFFFFNYEGHRQAQASSEQRSIPSPTLADGVIQYPCAGTSTQTPVQQCPGGTVQGATKTWNVAAGDFAIGPNNNSANTGAGLAQMDPLGIGPSPSSLAYFQSYYTNPAVVPNDPTETNADGLQLNFDGFRFPASEHPKNDIAIGRIDYKLTANGNHTLFWRGSGQDNYIPGAPFLPGGAPQTTITDFSKGMVFGYTAVLKPTLVNNFRYGYTRQSVVEAGDTFQPYVFIRELSQDVNHGIGFNFPVHNFTDDLSWTKGNHQFSFGTDISLVYNNSVSTMSSFSDGSMNAAWLTTGGFAIQNRDDQFNPDCATVYGTVGTNCSAVDTFPAVDPGFYNGYDFPLIGLLGMVTEVDAQYNVHVNSQGIGTPLTQGAGVPRHFADYETELYAQDAWKIRPNLTFTYGLRYEGITAPWETSGQQVAPTFDLGQWFAERGAGMAAGVPANQFPNITFDIAGRANNRPDWWATGRDFSPRLALAWSPEPGDGWLRTLFGQDKTSIRAGFGKYYDHFGPAMILTFDQSGGEFGLSTLLTNPAQVESAATSPRIQPISGQGLISAFNNIPTTDNKGNTIFTPAPSANFPLTFSPGNFCICWGIDSSLKTPYSYAMDFSVSRELPHNMSIEVAYIGRLGHNLLVQSDLAQPLNLRDPTSGITYYQAAAAMATVARSSNAFQPPSGQTTPAQDAALAAQIGPTAAYWHNLWTPLPTNTQGQPTDLYNTTYFGCGGPTASIVTAIYAAYYCNSNNETSALDYIDLVGIPSNNNFDPNTGTGSTYFAQTGQYTWFDNQYSSLFAWRSQSWSHYHAMQVTLRKQMSQGLQFNVNYTYSSSFDLASDAESVGEWSSLSGNVVNPWMGNQLSGPSDFDLRHQINGEWIWQLPFGQGRKFASGISKGLDAIVGGWQLSGDTRWSSGFPVSGGTCYCFPTNWQLTGLASAASRINGGHNNVTDVAGTLTYNLFKDPATAYNNFGVPLPGESGSRNPIRGDGFLNTDMQFSKFWKMPYNENHQLRLSADMFNVFNTKRFDVQSAQLGLDHQGSFGTYSRLLTLPRTMQFGLEYTF